MQIFSGCRLQATVFDRWMAHFVRWTRMPLAWAELFWQLAALFLILWAVKKIANRLFREESARWGGVAMVAAMFTLPVAGTALYMVDQHLHPRTLATAMILLAVWRILDEKRWQAAPLLLVAFLHASADGGDGNFILRFSRHRPDGPTAQTDCARWRSFDGCDRAAGLDL